MTDISARIIEDSVSPDGIRLKTYLLRYPRFIHAEFMTHRVFGRNGRSSRAVPVWKLLREPTVEPLFYGANQSGMASGEELTGWRLFLARFVWLGLAVITRSAVRVLHFAGLHKQWANRPLEWFGSIDVLVTATDWANFFALRNHPAAQPEIQLLARLMMEAADASTPVLLKPGQWHLPFVTHEERNGLPLSECLVLSTARCARLTFEPFDGAADYDAEYARYQRLIGNRPVHASPAEHQATPDHKVRLIERGYEQKPTWASPHTHGNLRGWCQHRKFLPYETVKEAA